jgi:hypothetical protein
MPVTPLAIVPLPSSSTPTRGTPVVRALRAPAGSVSPISHARHGLHIAEHRSRTAGSYSTDARARLEFAFEIDADVRTALLRCSDTGAPLIESSLADGIETTTYLGRLTIFGRPRDPNPRVVGDKTAMADLANRPHAALLHSLRDALEHQHISRDLYAAPRPNGSTATHLAAGESTALATWSWWWPVAIDVWSWHGSARYEMKDGRTSWADTINGWHRTAPAWSWWTVAVTNLYSTDTLGVDGTLL